MLRSIIQFLFPSICVVCGKPPTRLHVGCAQQLIPAEAPTQAWIFSCFSYRDTRVSGLVRHLKNKEDIELVHTLGTLLASVWHSHRAATSEQIILAPVPARAERMTSQGFNQAALLAKSTARNIPESICIPNLIERTRETDKQALIHNRQERLNNLKHVFVINPKKCDRIQDTTILIVDDVTTSGATLGEIRSVLLQAGAKDVYAITLAH